MESELMPPSSVKNLPGIEGKHLQLFNYLNWSKTLGLHNMTSNTSYGEEVRVGGNEVFAENHFKKVRKGNFLLTMAFLQ